MSNPVTRTLVGKYLSSSLLLLGHPNVAIGHIPDENHVSKTSVSLTNFLLPDIS